MDVIARSHSPSKDARLSTGYGETTIRKQQGARRLQDCLAPLAMTAGVDPIATFATNRIRV
jgi:hypothetical protein